MKEKQPRIFKMTAYLLFSILAIYAAVIAKNFFAPIALALLFAYLLYPVANFIEKKLRFPRILANLVSIILAIALLATGFFFLSKQLASVVSDLPALKANVGRNIHSLELFIETNFGVEEAVQEEWLRDRITGFFESSSTIITDILTATTGSLARSILIPVFVFFMLYYRDKAYEFILRLTTDREKTRIMRIINKVSNVTKNYMGGVVIVVLILCVLNPLGLYIVGIKYAIMLGIIAAICNFIPYFGTILGFFFPFMFALFTENSPHYAIGVIIVFFIVQFTENNILTPNIVGGNVRLNPFVIILSLIFGAMIWGVVGMLVVVPLMAVFRIICENTEKLKPYAFLLGTEGTQKHAITWDKIKGVFKKKK